MRYDWQNECSHPTAEDERHLQTRTFGNLRLLPYPSAPSHGAVQFTTLQACRSKLRSRLCGNVAACPVRSATRIAAGEFVAENDLAVAFLDAYPVSPGHCLIVPRRHEPDFLALSAAEQAAVWALVPVARAHIEKSCDTRRLQHRSQCGRRCRTDDRPRAPARDTSPARGRGGPPGGIRWVDPREGRLLGGTLSASWRSRRHRVRGEGARAAGGGTVTATYKYAVLLALARSLPRAHRGL